MCHYFFRGSCTIDDAGTGSVIVLGGMTNDVARYDLLGFVEDLPSMLRTRNGFACGSYLDSEGNQV